LKEFQVDKKEMKGILRDIYGYRYGNVLEYRLADAVDGEDFKQRLTSLRSIESPLPRFLQLVLK